MSDNTENIVLEPYNPTWPIKFQQEAAKIQEVIGGEKIISIEHIGSTAIPDLSAKPIIDIAIGVHSLETAKILFQLWRKWDTPIGIKIRRKTGCFL